MQMRGRNEDVSVVYSWSSNYADEWGNGTIVYTPATMLLTINAPIADMLEIESGIYEWDLQINYLGFHKVLTGGQLVFDDGTTR
jgi:hypothetical protein